MTIFLMNKFRESDIEQETDYMKDYLLKLYPGANFITTKYPDSDDINTYLRWFGMILQKISDCDKIAFPPNWATDSYCNLLSNVANVFLKEVIQVV